MTSAEREERIIEAVKIIMLTLILISLWLG